MGGWTFEGEAAKGPGKPPGKLKGAESVRPLGGIRVQAEGHGEMPGGGGATTVTTLGYGPYRKRCVGTFIAPTTTHLWVCDGALDAAERVPTLDTEGPDTAAEGKMAKFRDAIEPRSADHRVLTSRMLCARTGSGGGS